MLLKYGVNPFLPIRILEQIKGIDTIFQMEAKREAIMTSSNDGKHGKNSLHHKNEAWDFRIRDMEKDNKENAKHKLKHLLGKDWDVVLERTHCHLEYDPK